VFSNTDPTGPVIKIVDRIVPKTVATDEAVRSSYNSTLAAWVIVFIIVILATIFMGYLVHKGRKILALETKDLDKMEAVLNSKKSEADEQKVLLTGGSKTGKTPMKVN
jgi:beta-lactamase regulating signal transducer with metallopeptidase domain